jgi:caffeoyl-CoA O-methyltransferase
MKTRTMKPGLVFLAVAVVAGWAMAQPMNDRGGRRAHGGRFGPRADGPPGPGRFGPPPNPLIAILDADEDGQISEAEIDNAPAALRKLDKDNDGNLTPDELRAGGPEGGPGMGRPDRARPRSRGGRRRTGLNRTATEGSPLAASEQEKAVLAVLDDMRKNQSRGMMNVPAEDGRLLRLLAESIGAKHVVEVGTSNGYSSIWLCLALRTTGGKLTTYEIDARRAALARENFKRAGVDEIVTLVEGDAHEEVAKFDGSIDLVFLDADKEGYIDYLKKLLPKVRPGGLIVAHNMAGQADPRYVKAVTTDPALETAFLHMQGAGVGVTLKKR